MGTNPPLSCRKFSGKVLKATRQSMRISRPTLAGMLGVTTATIYNWETDRFSPNSNYLPKLAAALSKPEDYFYA